MNTELQTTDKQQHDAKVHVGSSYIIAKIEKGTERIVGFLSKGKRRWLPPLSNKHKRFEVSKELADKELALIKSKYDWQTTTHNYYYKLFVCGG